MVKDKYTIGKVIGKNIYIHRTLLSRCPSYKDYLSVIEQNNTGHCWNVIKLSKTKFGNFSLLFYKDFKKNPFPELRSSITIKEGKISNKRTYSSKNIPILHRKELLISNDNKNFYLWHQITVELEKIGALNFPKTIGHKLNWIKVLKSLTNEIQNAELKKYLNHNI